MAEIIGTLVILVATIAIGVTLFTIATGSVSIGIMNQSNNISLASQQVQERLSIYDVWFHSVGGSRTVQLHMINYGNVYVHIVTIYANLTELPTPQNNFTVSYPNGVTIAPGNQATITFGYAYSSGQNYQITLVSDSGSTFTGIWSA
ncbi:MAG: hypothetical protein JRN20_03880 [Nitrososphaerota archaeon]|nr:hypothetical protein [Nitrososphaerota archaeon]